MSSSKFMDTFDFEFYEKLASIQAPPGLEKNISKFCCDALKHSSKEAHKDGLGNIVAKIAGSGNFKLALCAHLDEIAMIVSKVEKNGMVRALPQGLFWNYCVDNQPVKLFGDNGISGVIRIDGNKNPFEETGLSDAVVDFGFKSDKKAKDAGLRTGDRITFSADLKSGDGYVSGKSADDRTGVYLLLQLAKKFVGMNLSYELYILLTVQEEGASIHQAWTGIDFALSYFKPDVIVFVDTFRAEEDPFLKKENEVRPKLNCGPAIVRGPQELDEGTTGAIIKTAEAEGVSHQILPLSATFTDAMVSARYGIRTGFIFIPVKSVHSAVETFSIADVNATFDLLKRVLKRDINRMI